MLTVFEDDALRISVIENAASDQLIVCFTGIGERLDNIDVQSEEFRRSARFATVLFVTDKRRTWGNSLDFSIIQSFVANYGQSKRVSALGNSMGGFIAIVASRFLSLETVIAIVPQYSVHKSIVPLEDRWSHFVDQINPWHFLSLDSFFTTNTRYYIIGSYSGDDRQHLDLMPSGDHIQKIYLTDPRFAHRVARGLLEDGILYDVLTDCLNGLSAREIASTRLHGVEHAVLNVI